MAEEVKLQKTVYDPIKSPKVVDTSFKTFAKPVPAEDTDTVEELFRLYNKLYLRIPSVDIQPLLDEITQLRQQLLSANQEILALSVQQSK